jgi:hypothetical protein
MRRFKLAGRLRDALGRSHASTPATLLIPSDVVLVVIQRKVSLMSSPLKTRSILWALALTSSIGAVQAQSSYVLTKLSEPFLGKLGAAGQIDSQNRDTATVYYVSGYKVFQWGAPPGYTYTSYVSRWAASTAASVTPSKLISQSDTFRHQSPDGNKVIVSLNDKQYYDTVKRQFVTIPAPIASERWDVSGINDSGAMAGTTFVTLPNQATQSVRALRWMPGASAPEMLPIGSEFNHSTSSFINRNGAVLGTVGVVGSGQSRTAIWRESGAFDVLNSEPDTNLAPLGMTDSGDVLVWITNTNTHVQSFAVISNGVAKTIAAPNAGDSLFPTAINAAGVVVGTINQPSAPEGFRDRGFIWKDGVLTDLTAWVTSKGLKLPQGTVIAGPWQINAQGSILASLRDASGKITLVRLTAKP